MQFCFSVSDLAVKNEKQHAFTSSLCQNIDRYKYKPVFFYEFLS